MCTYQQLIINYCYYTTCSCTLTCCLFGLMSFCFSIVGIYTCTCACTHVHVLWLKHTRMMAKHVAWYMYMYIVMTSDSDTCTIHSPTSFMLTAAGSKDDYRVIQRVSLQLLQCRCTRQLFPYLKAKRILTEQECAMMLRQPENEAAQELVDILTRITTGSSTQHLVSNLYLGLLDCYEGSVNVWCRNMATSKLRSAGKPVKFIAA